MLAAAYDPSRDLSPNLPTTCHQAGDSMSSSSSGLASCCSFKTEAEAFTHPCRDCGHYDPSRDEDQTFCRKSCQQEEFRERRELPLQYHPVEPKQEPPPQPPPEDEDVICAGCGRRISDRYYLFAVERRWHSSCLQCCQCRRTLDGEITCFARDGNIYCKKDYYR